MYELRAILIEDSVNHWYINSKIFILFKEISQKVAKLLKNKRLLELGQIAIPVYISKLNNICTIKKGKIHYI